MGASADHVEANDVPRGRCEHRLQTGTLDGDTGERRGSDPLRIVLGVHGREVVVAELLGLLEREAGAVNRYPDMFATGLVNALAERFDVPAEHIATGTGSVGVLQQVVQTTCGEGDEVVHAWRSFEAYPIVVQISGATSVPVPLTADEGHDLAGLFELPQLS